MTTTSSNLPSLISLLREGRDFYRCAERTVSDPEVREAFEHAASTRDALLTDLEAALPQPGESVPQSSVYTDLAQEFDGQHPSRHALALRARDKELLSRIETVFRSNPSWAVRAALKRSYTRLLRCEDINRRLAKHAEAA